jgi:hypothetical protein
VTTMAKPYTRLSRRDLITKAGLGLLGAPIVLDGLGITRVLPEFAAKAPELLPDLLALGEDSHVLIENALRGGAALARFGMAEAQGLKEDWTIITVKVFDQLDVGLLFALGKLNSAGTQPVTSGLGPTEHAIVSDGKLGASDAESDADLPGGATIAGLKSNAIRMLTGGGPTGMDARKLHSDARLKRLRFNEWFGQMMLTGESEVNYAVPSLHSGAFPENVAIQVALNLKRPQQAVNHQLNCVFLDEQADLNAFLESEGVVFSPMGYTTFMLGEHYDANNWPEDVNHVYRRMPGSHGTVPVSRGFKVSQYIANFDRIIRRPGFVDLAPGDANALLTYDRYVEKDPRKRREFIERRAKLVSSLVKLEGLGQYESSKLTTRDFTEFLAVQGAGRFKRDDQSQIPEITTASKDFLAQCQFVARALDFEDKPLRNFNLFLNLADLDGKGFLSVRNGDAGKPRSYNYIEGIRQLAVGLNVLAHAIKGKRAIVNVVTDACRKDDNGDGDNGLAILLGPKGAGDLDDALYCSDFSLQGEYKAATEKNSLRNYAEFSSAWNAASRDAFEGVPSLSNWQYGIADYVMEKAGRLEARTRLLSPVKLKRMG